MVYPQVPSERAQWFPRFYLMGTVRRQIAKRRHRAVVAHRLHDWHLTQLRECRFNVAAILRRVEHSETFKASRTVEPDNFPYSSRPAGREAQLIMWNPKMSKLRKYDATSKSNSASRR